MRLVGVDLAWGTRAPTGLAAVSVTGDLLAVATVTTDDEIVEWLELWAPGDCLVAVDAPLVVRNATGMRQCERLVGRYFARFGIGCHAANLANPAFVDGGRAARLSLRVGLDVDLEAAGSGRHAVEVYPHTAVVQLFGLEQILRYKHKPGRSVDSLAAELGRLLDLLEDLESADPPLRVRTHHEWARIRRVVAGATRKVDLRRVEDAVDAVLCAYVALLAHARPDRVRVLGDTVSGAILTPVDAATAARIDSA